MLIERIEAQRQTVERLKVEVQQARVDLAVTRGDADDVDDTEVRLPDSFHIARGREISRILNRHNGKVKHPQVIPPPRNKEPLGHIGSVLHDGDWTGNRCFIIGGGPSLKGFDFSRLYGELVIGINRAFEAIDPAILFAMDGPFIDRVRSGGYGSASLSAWNAMRGMKVYCRKPSGTLYPDTYHVERSLRGWATSISKGITSGNNSGVGALALAIALGANPIYLLGYDMRGSTDKQQAWWHSGHPTNQGSAVYKTMVTWFTRYEQEIKAQARVINCNPDSALRCFEFGEVPMSARNGYRVISFYTKGTSYETEIKKLEKSLIEHNIPYHFFGYPPNGTWRSNLNYKSQCILEAMDKFPNDDVVFLDSDAVVRQYPVLFADLSKNHTHDISAHFFEYSERSGGFQLLSGTLWIANNETGRKMVQRWHDVGLARPAVRHQMCLWLAIQELQKEGVNIRINKHPFAYTCIFDYVLAKQCTPVIEHFQASRRFRREVGYGVVLGNK
jgi:hypothetical protein